MGIFFKKKNYIIIFVIFVFALLEYFEVVTIRKGIIDQYLNLFKQFNESVNPIGSIEVLKNSQDKNSNTIEIIEKLKKELSIQKYLVKKYSFLQDENLKLKKQLGYEKDFSDKIISARVNFIDPQNHFISLWIDKGSEDGIELSQPVVGFQKGVLSLIGFIDEIEIHHSQVKTIIDQQTHVAIVVGDTGSRAIIKGQSKFNSLLKIDFLDRSLENIERQPIYTSGLGGKYPPDILVGHVETILPQNFGLFQNALVKPAINFFTIEDVIVISKEKVENKK